MAAARTPADRARRPIDADVIDVDVAWDSASPPGSASARSCGSSSPRLFVPVTPGARRHGRRRAAADVHGRIITSQQHASHERSSYTPRVVTVADSDRAVLGHKPQAGWSHEVVTEVALRLLPVRRGCPHRSVRCPDLDTVMASMTTRRRPPVLSGVDRLPRAGTSLGRSVLSAVIARSSTNCRRSSISPSCSTPLSVPSPRGRTVCSTVPASRSSTALVPNVAAAARRPRDDLVVLPPA
jgi:hypothetical protein